MLTLKVEFTEKIHSQKTQTFGQSSLDRFSVAFDFFIFVVRRITEETKSCPQSHPCWIVRLRELQILFHGSVVRKLIMKVNHLVNQYIYTIFQHILVLGNT